ncbi:hypothetical protein ACGFSI_40530 [Streptomyces virginiae]|uniref:hypothetical protein n=1 Tax=Streptomyces virginiae TaxID=1961 RepID=UPI00371F3A92
MGRLEGPDEEERVIGRTADHVLQGIDPGHIPLPGRAVPVGFGSEPTGFDVLDATVVNKMVAPVRAAPTCDGGSDKDLAVVGDSRPGSGGHFGCSRDSQAVAPFWEQVELFALTSASQLRPPPPDLYGTYEKLLAGDDYQRQVGTARTARHRQAHGPYTGDEPYAGPGSRRPALGSRRGRP